jgi:hypothetical protein
MPQKITKKSYSNAPSPKLLQKIGATNLALADAIAEIVANSFDGSVDDERSVIEVNVDRNRISIVDNGIGMTEDVLVEAVKLGVDMSDVVKKKVKGKGKFGLGMKTACASMGKWWAVHTRPLGEDTEYRVEFDLAEWERRPDSADAWTIEIQSLEHDKNGPLGDRDHGTAVLIENLRSKDPLHGPVLKKLGESFKPHLLQGDKILINGRPATPHEYTFVPGSKVPIDIKFGDAKEYSIKGWVALDTQLHNDGQYGFNIYRRGQLVETWNQDWFRLHLMTSRIIGEVEMDFIDATFFKQGLQQLDLWRQASAEMHSFLKPIVAASSDLSRKGNIKIPAKRLEIVQKMRSDLGIEPATFTEQEEQGSDNHNGESGHDRSQSFEFPKLQVEADELVLESGANILISRIERSMGKNGPPFDYIDAGDPVDLQTVINTDHELFINTKDKDQLRKLGIADSILRYLVDKCGEESKAAVRIRNSWLLTSNAKVKEAGK